MSPLPATVTNEGLGWDSLLRMFHNPGGDWNPGQGDIPNYNYITPVSWLIYPRKLGSMVNKWVISPTYIFQWDILGWNNPLILTFDPNLLGHPSKPSKWVSNHPANLTNDREPIEPIPCTSHQAGIFFFWAKIQGDLFLGGGNSNIFVIFTPKLGEDEPNLTGAYFSIGFVQPPTSFYLFGDLINLILRIAVPTASSPLNKKAVWRSQKGKTNRLPSNFQGFCC